MTIVDIVASVVFGLIVGIIASFLLLHMVRRIMSGKSFRWTLLQLVGVLGGGTWVGQPVTSLFANSTYVYWIIGEGAVFIPAGAALLIFYIVKEVK